MSEWFDLLVYVGLIIAFCFVLPTWSARFTLATVADRNPQWLRDHPDVAARLRGGRVRWWYYAWGIVSLSALIAFQAGLWPRQWSPVALGMARWETLKELNTLLFVPGMVVFVGAGVLFSRWLTSTVPPLERRRATLERRTVDDFVPRWAQVAVYALIALNLAAWLGIAALGWNATPEFWSRFVLLLVMTPIFLFLSRLSIRRPPQALDRIFGPAFRRIEARYGLAMNLVLPVVGAFRLYEEFADTTAFDVSRAMHLGLVLCLTAGILRLARFAKGQAGADGAGPWSATPAAIVLLAGTLLAPSSAWAQAPTPLSDDAIRRLLAERVDTYGHSVGIVVGIVEPNGRRVIAYGTRSKSDTTPVDGDTVFELASVTKALTSLLLADAVTRGEVALDDPVAKYLPPSVRMPERGARSITLHDLATHTSGLPREPSNLQPNDPSNPFADYSVEQLYQFLSGHQLTRDIGSEFDYSNLGAGLLGHVLARRAGTDYETLLRARITGPLGMSSTGIMLSPAMRARLAAGHNRFLEPAPNWDSPTLAGAGAVRSTVNDMLRFLAAALDGERARLGTAFALMTSARRSPAPAFDVGLGWGIAKNRGTEIVFVNGRSGGYRTWLGYEPRTRRGVVVLTNADGVIGPDDLGRHVLNPAFPLLPNIPTAPAPRRHTQVDPAIFDRYVGNYQLAPVVSVIVTRQGNRFFSQVTGEPPFELFAESEKVYFLKAADAELTFESDATGKPTTLLMRANGVTHRAPRVDGTLAVPRELAVDPVVLERYVGRYEFVPGVTLAISRKDARLFAQLTGQAVVEIFASSERQFFYKVVNAELTFDIDDAGRATAVVLRQNGVEQRAQRID